MPHNSLVLPVLLLAVGLSAQHAGNAPRPESKPAPNFQGQEFRSALVEVLHARFDSFSELKTDAAVFQLPQMSCSLSPTGNLTSYICFAPASQSEAEDLYGSLAAAVAGSLPGYPPCHKKTVVNEMEHTSFCHYPQMLISDASVQNWKGVVSLEVFSREAGDRGEPAQLLHAYALADLGRHAEAINAFDTIYSSDFDKHDHDQERSAYDLAIKWTQGCAESQSCMADDFLAIGKPRDALRWQSQLFKTLRQGQTVNLRQSEKLDPASARTTALADAYDLNARIQAAMGRLAPALRDLDSAINALPKNPETAPREATYYYHRALILAENRRFADAAKACRDSFAIAGSVPGERREPQCLEIDELCGRSE